MTALPALYAIAHTLSHSDSAVTCYNYSSFRDLFGQFSHTSQKSHNSNETVVCFSKSVKTLISMCVFNQDTNPSILLCKDRSDILQNIVSQYFQFSSSHLSMLFVVRTCGLHSCNCKPCSFNSTVVTETFNTET